MRVQASVCVWEASGERGQRTGKARRESGQQCSGGRVPTSCAARWSSETPRPGRPSAALEWGKAGGN